jgi:hypothetical protein
VKNARKQDQCLLGVILFAAQAKGAGECRRFNMYAFYWRFIFLAECGAAATDDDAL